MSKQNHRCMNCGQEPWNREAAPEITEAMVERLRKFFLGNYTTDECRAALRAAFDKGGE